MAKGAKTRHHSQIKASIVKMKNTPGCINQMYLPTKNHPNSLKSKGVISPVNKANNPDIIPSKANTVVLYYIGSQLSPIKTPGKFQHKKCVFYTFKGGGGLTITIRWGNRVTCAPI